MPFSLDLIYPAVARYRRERDRYVKLADRIAEICRDDICERNAIRAQVTFRAKTEKSLEGKLKRFSQAANKNYPDEEAIFADLSDLAAVRIAAYRLEDCDKVVEHLKSEFRGSEAPRVKSISTVRTRRLQETRITTAQYMCRWVSLRISKSEHMIMLAISVAKFRFAQ